MMISGDLNIYTGNELYLMYVYYYFRHFNEEYGVQMMSVSNEYADVIKYVNEKNMVDNVYLSFPEGEIDMNEDCIWRFSKEAHGHIPPYFIDAGWNYDDRRESYIILYK